MRGPRTALLAFALLPALALTGCVSHQGPLALTSAGVFSFHAVERSNGMPVPVGGCDELQGTLLARARTQAQVLLDQSVAQGGRPAWYGRGMVDDVAMPMASSTAAAGAAAQSAAPPQAPQVTGTNNQEKDADEGDLVKTDGTWTYVLHDGVLRILRSASVGDAQLVSSTSFEGGDGMLLLVPRQAGASDDRLVLVQGGAVAGEPARSILRTGPAMTHVAVLDVSDRSKPTTIQEQWIEGTPVGARLVAGTAYVVVHKSAEGLGLITSASPDGEVLAEHGLDWNSYSALDDAGRKSLLTEVARAADQRNAATLASVSLDEQLPRIVTTQHGLAVPQPVDDRACRRVLSPPDATGRGMSTILSLAASEPAVKTSIVQVAGSDPILYANGDSLVLASSSQDDFWYWVQPGLETATDLQWFHLDGLSVTPVASGLAPGLVEDSFGLDVHDGSLRVVSATGTYNRGWLPETDLVTTVTVFDAVEGLLVPRGSVTGIAPGEHLWSARFTDDRAYLVTFRGMDPLWVVDLAGPVPTILGELKVAGVSTYIHPLGDEKLLTLGYGGGDNGQGLDESRILVSLFDVADPSHPKQLDVVDLSPPNGGSFSTALHEHKAFTYWSAVGTLAVPVGSYGPSSGGDSSHVGLDLVKVDLAKGDLSLKGYISQDALKGAAANYGWGTEVERSFFLGYPERGQVSVYAISRLGVTANDLATLKQQAAVPFA